jgi:hypothetical protein
MGGYSFSYTDSSTCTTSPLSICIDSTAVCVSGMTGVSSSTCYGGGFGINVGQTMGSMTAGTVAATATAGLTYSLSNVPTIAGGGVRIQVVTGTAAASATNSYCAPITAPSGTIPWSSFELTCYATPPGTALTGPPADIQQVEVTIDDGTAAAAYNFCIDSITF